MTLRLTLESPQVTQRLTQEYEQQLKTACAEAAQQGTPEPREALKLVSQVSVKEGVLHLTRTDGAVNFRFFSAELNALEAALNKPEEQQKVSLLFKEVIEKTLRFPAHENDHLSLKRLEVDKWLHGADFQTFFVGTVLKRRVARLETYSQILHAHEFSDHTLHIQHVPILKPDAGQEVVPIDDFDKMISEVFQKAKANIRTDTTPKSDPWESYFSNQRTIVGPDNTLYLIKGKKASNEKDPRVKIFQEAILQNAMQMGVESIKAQAAGKETTETKKSSTNT